MDEIEPDVRHNIVIEYAKKNGGAFSTLEKNTTEAQLRTVTVYALRLFVYRLRLRSAPLYEWVEIWYVGSL